MSNKNMDKRTAERFLGLSGTYTAKDLNSAYRKKVREYHPDLVAARGEDTTAAEELMMTANAANELLKCLFDDVETVIADPDPKPASTVKTPAAARVAQRSKVREAASDEYGGWDPDSMWGQAYKKANDAKVEREARAKASREAAVARQRAEYEEWRRAHGLDVQASVGVSAAAVAATPVERFRWQDGPVPADIAARYARIDNAKIRLIYVLICFFYCLVYLCIDLAGSPTIHHDMFYTATMLFFFFTGGAELLTGSFSRGIKTALARKVDRDLAQWRYENGYNG